MARTRSARVLPNDVFLALINANNPSAGNPYATIADLTGIVPIQYALNYSALPPANTVPGQFYYVENSQGTKWLPGSMGGTYYSNGLYYSNGTSWVSTEIPWEASQVEVNTGLVTFKFVTPATLKNSTQWDTKANVRNARTAVSNTSITNTDDIVHLNGNITATLDSASSFTTFKPITVKNTSLTDLAYLTTTGGELIDDVTLHTIYPLESFTIAKDDLTAKFNIE